MIRDAGEADANAEFDLAGKPRRQGIERSCALDGIAAGNRIERIGDPAALLARQDQIEAEAAMLPLEQNMPELVHLREARADAAQSDHAEIAAADNQLGYWIAELLE